MKQYKEYIKQLINKHKFIKFLFVGGSSTLLDFIVYMLLSNFILLSIAKALSMVLSCTYSFCLNRRWTFQNKQKINSNQLMKYIVTQLINIITNVMINQFLYMLTNNKLIAYIVATTIAMLINYVLQKNVVFKEK